MNPTHDPNRVRDALAGITCALLIILASLAIQACNPPSADAHTVTPSDCRTYARTHRLITGTPTAARAAMKRCTRARIKHASQHATIQCIRKPGSRLGAGVCRAIATVKPAWATDNALHELIRRESSANPNAINRSSGACGLFQRLPCPWRTSKGAVHASPLVQARNGVAYIRGRYGTPARAIQHHNRVGWY